MTQIKVAELLQHQLDRQRRSMLDVVRFNDARNRARTLEILGLTTRLEEERVKFDQLRCANERLQRLVEDMRESSSWRMTGPLRIVADLVRKMARS